MVAHYLEFWTTHRATLLDGALSVHGYVANFAYVSARRGSEQIGALYAGQSVPIEQPSDHIIVVNATPNTVIWVSGIAGAWTKTVTDCMGNVVCREVRTDRSDGVLQIAVPVNGYVYLDRVPNPLEC